jgi:hypothetical protein
MSVRILVIAAVLAITVAACGGAAGGGSSGSSGEVRLRVVAGPVCPVETVPPKPECRPRAVDGARIELDGPARVAVDVHGGTATVDLPPGTYTVTPEPVSGLMGTAPATTVKVVAGRTTPLRLVYDTGIR